MSFGNFARKVRDPALPYRHRVSALRSYVQLYRPLGFLETLSFLELKAGRFQRDETALLRALEVIEESRAAREAAVLAYATIRREAKRQGRRIPRREDFNPNAQDYGYWFGAPGEAARHALRFWLQRRLPGLRPLTDPVLLELSQCVSLCLESDGELRTVERDTLAARMNGLERSVQSWDLLKIVRLIGVAIGSG
ncbi:hypothetical protein [Streptosporangium sp. NPDC051022]|uniref:hypothetical protein n=1 Tax=Streptosporangium sp. NPDC051022 TaxID=3155752 RepID=UPI003419891C